MNLVLAGELASFDFLNEYDFCAKRNKLFSAVILEVELFPCETVLFATVGHTKVEITGNLIKILETYDVEHIILMGNCGLLKPCLASIGDIAISTQVFQHDLKFCAIGFPQSVRPIRGGESSFVKASKHLITLACDAAREICMPHKKGIYTSGDQFLANREQAKHLVRTFDASFADSESAAVTEVAQFLKTPYVVVKGISNIVSPEGGHEFEANEAFADCVSGQVVLEMLRCL